MLSFKKSLVVAAAIMACMFLFTTLHRDPIPDPPKATTAGSLAEGFTTKPLPSGPKLPSEDIGRSGRHQKPLSSPGTSLKDRLRFQYPYEPSGKFPAYIWQTWKVSPSSEAFAEGLRPQEASWTEKHPGFVHEVITDVTARRLVRYLYSSVPEVLEAYDALPLPVLKADYFRYLVLFARGGIYSDIDTEALKSASEWLPQEVSPTDVGLIVGIEADPDRPDWAQWFSRRIQFCQWTIQAKPGHPVLRDIIAYVTEDALRMKHAGILKSGRMDKSIVEFTGPAVWTDKIFDYFNNPTYFQIDSNTKNISWDSFSNIQAAKRVGDVVVLPITSFSPGVGQMNAGEIDDEMAFVKHDFEGSWKEDWEKIKPIVIQTIYETVAEATPTPQPI